jgi:Ca-activated chloride channel family protein
MKQEVRRLRSLAPGDRVALIAFAGRSYILTPLTVDDSALELFLDNLDPRWWARPAARSRARSARPPTCCSRPRPRSDRAVVLMSDGEAFETAEEVETADVARARRVFGGHGGFGTPAARRSRTSQPNGR